MKKITCLLLLVLSISTQVYADSRPRNGMTDPRVKLVTYNVRDVVTITAHYGFSTMIQLSDSEKIETISLGDTLAWNVLDVDNMIFLKPVEDRAETNMQVVTDKRVYNFALEAHKAQHHRDNELTFSLRFRYPDDELRASQAKYAALQAANAPGPEEVIPNRSFGAGDVNMEYAFRGSEDIAPRRVFDDGEFTYFQFNKVTEAPAIFVQNNLGDDEESLVNFHISGKYVVVQRLARKFVLRHGSSVTCIYNEKYLPDSEQEIRINNVDTADNEKRLPVVMEGDV